MTLHPQLEELVSLVHAEFGFTTNLTSNLVDALIVDL